MNVDKREMEKLILAYFDEGLNASDQRRLATLLRDDPDAQAMFHSHMRLEGSMVSLAQAGFISDPELEATVSADSSAPVAEPRPSETRSVTLWIHRIVIGTAALVAGFYLAQIMAPSSQLDIATPKVGHFSRIIAAEWVSGAPTLGSDVTLGTYELKSGIVEFEFDNGATVILEGPAHFEVNTAERTFLHHGRVRTHVPPQAYGFTMDTQTMHVVDLGTEFGMEVNPDGAAEVHVFDGEVEILQRQMTDDTPRLFLAAGEGLRLEHSGLQSDIDADLDAFVDQFTLESRAATYLDDLADQLAKVQQEQKDLTKRLRQAESKTRQSPELQKLRKAATWPSKSGRTFNRNRLFTTRSVTAKKRKHDLSDSSQKERPTTGRKTSSSTTRRCQRDVGSDQEAGCGCPPQRQQNQQVHSQRFAWISKESKYGSTRIPTIL